MRSATRFQNLPRLWTSPRNVLIIPAASNRTEQFNRDVKNEVNAAGACLLGEELIANGLHFGRNSSTCFPMLDVLLAIMEYCPAFNTIYPRASIAVHHGFVRVARNQRRPFGEAREDFVVWG